MQKRLISIVVPVYNSEIYLDKCIKSIISQKYIDWELILVDDGSTDSSYILCKSYEKLDSRIRCIHKNNGGVSSARNCGINNATGEYITFIDSDDFVDDNYLEILNSLMIENIGMVVLGLKKYFLDNGKYRKIKSKYDGRFSYEEFSKIIIDDGTLSGFTLHSSCSLLYDLSIIKNEKLYFDEKVKYNEDGLFTSEYFFASKKDVYICSNIVPYNYTYNNLSASSLVDLTNEKYINSMTEIFEKLNEMKNKYNYSEISNQIVARKLTLELNKILYLSKCGDYDVVKEEMKKFRINIVHKNFKRMNFKKIIFVLLLRLKLYFLAYVLIR